MKKTILSLLCCSLLVACTETYRPAYHHTPERNWMNDPNGMFYDDVNQVWHLYFQHNPYATVWGHMTWAHSTSTDLIHWKAQPNAIMPDSLGTIFSGSAVIDKYNTAGFGENAVVAMFTYSEKVGQIQAIAYSNDGGYTFTKYEGNPVLTADIKDFRDPKVFWNENTCQWNMVLAAGQEVRFYSSPNLKEWTYLSSFGEGLGCHGGVWECPDLMLLPVRGTEEQKWVLIVNINPGGPFGGSATQYFVGDWDGQMFTTNQTNTQWMDYGKDHYATVSFHNAPNNRHVVLAWMSNWQYADRVPTKHFRSANSIARDIDLYVDANNQYRIGVRPAPEMEAMSTLPTQTLAPLAKLEVNVIRGTEPASITLSNDKGEQVVMTYDFENNTFSMDRTASGLVEFAREFPCVTSVELENKSEYQLILYIDRCSIEAFDGEGLWSMTNLVFPTKPYNQVQTQGCEAKLYKIN